MFVEIAREYNLIEGTPSFKRFINDFNQSNLVSYKMTYTDNWCACFVSWVLYKANCPLKKSVGVLDFKNKNIDYFIPLSKLDKFKYDDILIIDHGKGSGHIGFVTKDTNKNADIPYISGNSNNRVRITYTNTNESNILGVIRYFKGNKKIEILTDTYVRDYDTLKPLGIVKKGTIAYFKSLGIKGAYERGLLLDIATNKLLYSGCVAKSNRTMREII